jgi:hypothetical protein
MKPGDLVRLRKMNITYGVPIDYINVWDSPDGEIETQQREWEHGELGVFIGGRYEEADLELIEVLLGGRVWWAMDDEVEAVSETG